MDERNEIKKKLKTTKRYANLTISQVDNTVDPLPSQSNLVSVEVNKVQVFVIYRHH